MLSLLLGCSAFGQGDQASATPAVKASLTATLEAWRVVQGGVDRGHWSNALVHADAVFDAARLGAIPGSTIVAQAHGVLNRRDEGAFAESVGAWAPVSSAFASDHLRIYNLYFRTESQTRGWAAKAGLLALDDDFMLSEVSALFVNSAFGPMPSQVATTLSARESSSAAFPIYPVTAPGVWVQVNLSDSTLWQTGLYHGAPGNDLGGNEGFDWAKSGNAGLVLFSEVQRRAVLAGRSSTTKLGIAGHTGRFDDYRARLGGAVDATARGLLTVYAVQEVTLASGADGKPKLGAFGRMGAGTRSDRDAIRVYADAGLAWFGPLENRPDDLAAVAYSTLHFNRAYRELSGLASYESTLEVMYRCVISRHVAVSADVQWLFNASNGQGRGTAAIAGVRTTLSF